MGNVNGCELQRQGAARKDNPESGSHYNGRGEGDASHKSAHHTIKGREARKVALAR